MKKHILKTSLLGVLGVVFLTSCFNDDPGRPEGEVAVKVTDARVDTENIAGVYLSVSEVQAYVNGSKRVIAQFDEPQTFNLMAYQNGDTYFLGNGNIESGTYHGLRFILSGEHDSYLLMNDDTQVALTIPSGASSGYKIAGEFEVSPNTTTSIVADIDLRKALVVTGNGEYKLRPTGRVVTEAATGTIEGTVVGNLDANKEYVVYAYAKGTYDASEEAEPAEGETRFQNSINSAVVNANGSYTLAFMPPGEYEIILAAYSNMDEDADLEFESVIQSEVYVQGESVSEVSVAASATIIISIVL